MALHPDTNSFIPEIRLGDVVVGRTGVIQYDIGKWPSSDGDDRQMIQDKPLRWFQQGIPLKRLLSSSEAQLVESLPEKPTIARIKLIADGDDRYRVPVNVPDMLRQTLATIKHIQSSAARGDSSSTQKFVASGRSRSTRQGLTLEVNGRVNGMAVVAFPDTGSCFDIISEEKATLLGLGPVPGTHGQMSLPNGNKAMSPGQVQLAFNFDGEEETHDLLCSILPGTTRDLVLGSVFLKATKTMTSYAHRVKRIFCKLAQPSLNLIGAEQDFLGGYINGRECLAVPDTGSDVMDISLKHARRLGLKVHRKARHRTLVEFLDGSRVRTKGIAEAEWQFAYGEPIIRCDFHVIKGLPVDAVLNNTMLHEHDVFRQYEGRIGSSESLQSTASLGIYGISLVEVCEQKIRSLSDSYLDDIKSDNPFTPEKIERERARRDGIRDAIAQIPDEVLRATKQHQEYL
ncbi:hypothetical protein CGMCC3_g411 [Colletotrichum fructicola]|uniref:Uncharacterized protein n=1 Tax=Colletotrichum fructicola (strain Nara gc5) TaxID=1213859 RepID=L2G7N4_COLFN|nr:uncharacterized protein CGMCC3_g411 [Colletotrichum fructicola]KAE9583533.1 hypothetical protein CGMCC3_g411 [Colletotrichum fructicola]KAF4427610.1 hypothetical protein CFRS1_v005786 [Colletotrichum fructicola]KAF4487275.1 hypothetical protein CGGC5_v005023 [Colletotrichum fructicola Nara gc5]KAF4890877.1 hypothetical protein CGCFRS4_v008554 [Colletotrichum fructicola]